MFQKQYIHGNFETVMSSKSEIILRNHNIVPHYKTVFAFGMLLNGHLRNVFWPILVIGDVVNYSTTHPLCVEKAWRRQKVTPSF